MINNFFKLLSLLFFIFFLISNFSFTYGCGLINSSTSPIIKIIEPGFKNTLLFLTNQNHKTSILITTKIKINLRRNEIKELQFHPKNKPSGFKILKNTYIKARVSHGYMIEFIKDMNGTIGIGNRFLKEDDITTKVNNKKQPLTEGGIEIRYYF